MITEERDTELGDGTVITTRVVQRWGCKLPGGVIRWDPGYGSGGNVPYTEAQARDDVQRSGGELVTRARTEIVVETPWARA
jgi:hypothetical protein